jgi:hypothetical protein
MSLRSACGSVWNLRIVGEVAGLDLVAEEGDPDSVGSRLVEIPETMVARFVWDVSGNVHSFTVLTEELGCTVG